MTAQRLTINDLIRPFFDTMLVGSSGIKHSRIERVEALLRECLEVTGERVLVDRDRGVLAAEQQFNRVDAFARTMHADDLIYVLTTFLEPPWLQADPLLQKVQLTITERLTATILHDRLVVYSDLVCPLMDIGASLENARRRLNEDRRERARLK